MLQHADRHKGIVLALNVAVVVFNIFDLCMQALFAGLRLSIGNLLLRNIVGVNLNPIMTCHVTRQPTPAATGLNHCHAGFEPELSAYMLQLCQLCLLRSEEHTSE